MWPQLGFSRQEWRLVQRWWIGGEGFRGQRTKHARVVSGPVSVHGWLWPQTWFGGYEHCINVSFKSKECLNHSAFSMITFHNCVVHSHFEALGGCNFALSDSLLGPECMGFCWKEMGMGSLSRRLLPIWLWAYLLSALIFSSVKCGQW